MFSSAAALQDGLFEQPATVKFLLYYNAATFNNRSRT